MSRLTEPLKRTLDALSDAFEARYGEDLSDLTAHQVDGSRVIRGAVISEKQLTLLESLLRRSSSDTEALPRLEVVALTTLPRGDARLPGRLTHPEAGPVPLYSRAGGAKLATEWLASDGDARILYRGAHRLLVQLIDGTVAWCDPERGVEGGTSSGGEPGGTFVETCLPGGTTRISPTVFERLCIDIGEMGARGIHYRLGGRSLTAGVDCSALVQLVIREHTGVLLPRHSGDQMKAGIRIAKRSIDRGDLVFARTQTRNHLHVGFMIDPETIVHACRLEGATRTETLEAFFERYRFLRARRLFEVA